MVSWLGVDCVLETVELMWDVGLDLFGVDLGVGQLGISWMIDDRCRHRVR